GAACAGGGAVIPVRPPLRRTGAGFPWRLFIAPWVPLGGGIGALPATRYNCSWSGAGRTAVAEASPGTRTAITSVASRVVGRRGKAAGNPCQRVRSRTRCVPAEEAGDAPRSSEERDTWEAISHENKYPIRRLSTGHGLCGFALPRCPGVARTHAARRVLSLFVLCRTPPPRRGLSRFRLLLPLRGLRAFSLPDAALTQGRPDELHEIAGGERFGDIVHAQLSGFPGTVKRRMGGHEDDRQRGVGVPETSRQSKSV